MVIPDGLPDLRIKKFNNKTPLDAAKIPSIDHILKKGLIGVLRTIPEGKQPGSDVANLSLLGVDPRTAAPGRGALEALAQNIKIKKNETAFRMNFVTVEKNVMKDYTGGNIKTPAAVKIIELLNKEFEKSVRFYSGVDYRNIAVIKKSDFELKIEPPHNILDKKIRPYLPKGAGKEYLIDIMNRANKIITASGYYKEKKIKANNIWLWGEGRVTGGFSFFKKYNLKAAVISAVDIIKGIARFLDMDVIDVPGITGDFNTNYRNKSKYALKNLKKFDLVCIHIEATDEAGHKGDFQEKKAAIEKIDKHIIKPLLESNLKFNIIFVPDHPTPLKYRTHTNQEVPFIIYSKIKEVVPNHKLKHYSEEILKKPPVFIKNGYRFLDLVISMLNEL